MAPRHVLPALVAAGALILPACGSEDAAAPVATTPVASPSPVVAAAQAAPATAGESGGNGASGQKGNRAAAATVAPEVVVPTTTDPVAQANLGGWQGATLASLRQLDPRLVLDEQAAIRRVRSACEAFSTGLFQAKAVELVRTKFSTKTLRLTEEQAELVYQVLLREACYPMSSQDAA